MGGPGRRRSSLPLEHYVLRRGLPTMFIACYSYISAVSSTACRPLCLRCPVHCTTVSCPLCLQRLPHHAHRASPAPPLTQVTFDFYQGLAHLAYPTSRNSEPFQVAHLVKIPSINAPPNREMSPSGVHERPDRTPSALQTPSKPYRIG